MQAAATEMGDNKTHLRNRKAHSSPSNDTKSMDVDFENILENETSSNNSDIPQSSTTMVHDLCEQLRADFILEINANLKESLDSAVDRILEQSQLTKLVQPSNMLRDKWVLRYLLTIVQW